MNKYVIHSNNPTMVLRSDGASIPMDERNPDYQEYLKWVENGNVAQIIDPPEKPLESRIQNELRAQGVTMEAKVDALWALMVDEDPKLVDELKNKIATAKAKHAK